MNLNFSEKQRCKLLFKFLKKKQSLQSFITNVLCNHDATKYIETKDIIGLLKHYTDGEIGHAFIWRITKEGHDFWFKLDREFHDFCHSYNIGTVKDI